MDAAFMEVDMVEDMDLDVLDDLGLDMDQEVFSRLFSRVVSIQAFFPALVSILVWGVRFMADTMEAASVVVWAVIVSAAAVAVIWKKVVNNSLWKHRQQETTCRNCRRLAFRLQIRQKTL